MTRKENQQHFSKEELDRIFEKQAEHEIEKEKKTKKEHEERLEAKWVMEKTRPHQFPNDALAKEKRLSHERRKDTANAKQELRSIQSYLERRRRDEHRAIIKDGVLQDAIQIHETDNGFEIDTPAERVEEYVQQHPHTKSKVPKVEDLMRGRFLTTSVGITSKEEIVFLREALIEEYNANSPSDLMLIDLVISNYYRAMYATKMEMESLLYATEYRMEMFEVNATGVQPYINACQNQFLKTLQILR